MDRDVPAPSHPPGQSADGFLGGGGGMGASMRAHDWSASALGPPTSWPQALRTSVRLILNTGHPMSIWWGPGLACLHNDAYGDSIGPERHPGSLGLPARQVWAETWPIIGPQIEQVLQGRGATWSVDHLLPVTPHGPPAQVHWTYSCCPIDDETSASGIGGVLVICTETTQPAAALGPSVGERHPLAQMFEQAPSFMALLRGAEHRFQIANPGYMKLVGHRPILGRTVAEAVREAVGQGYVALLDQVFASGKAYTATGARWNLQPTPGGPVIERFVDFVYQPIKNLEGRVTSIFVQGVDATERNGAELALRESEARFRAALRAGRMGSWETDRKTMTRTWSEEGMALFGLQLPGGRGQVGGDGDEYVAAMHPQDRHLAAHFQALADLHDSFPAEYRIVRPDGATLWLSGRGRVVERGPDGRALRLVSIMADATERMQAVDVLRVERERLALALSAGEMGAYDLNIQSDILWWSPQTYTIFGVSPETFTPTRAGVSALIHPDDLAAYERFGANAILDRRPFSHVFRVCRPDGTVLWASNRGELEYDSQGLALRSFGIVMDITERRQIEQVLRDAGREKDTFIATLAHELRNPLAPIRNAVDILKRAGPGDTGVAWCHDVIDRQVGQMTHLLDDLLDVSRMGRNHIQLRREPVQLATVVDHAVELAQTLIDAGEHTFSVSLPQQPLTLHGDLTRLAQVFSNVLINAAKYTPPRGRITLTACCERDEAVVRVTDSGIGIDVEHMVRIFELFGQVESVRGYGERGQGIGLSLAKGLVELHGGSIHVHSEGAGKGSQFEIRLPLSSAMGLSTGVSSGSSLTQPEATAASPHGGEPDAPPQRLFRVLVADDFHDIADSLSILLQCMGHTVAVAYGGKEALRLAQALQPEVVLLDIGMPDIDGYEVCRRIRAEPWGGEMLLIAQTGWGQEGDRRKSTEAGFDHHLVKPIDPTELVSLFSLRRPSSARLL